MTKKKKRETERLQNEKDFRLWFRQRQQERRKELDAFLDEIDREELETFFDDFFRTEI